MDIFFVAAGPRYVRRRPGTTAVTAYPPALLLAASRASSITSASMSSMCSPISRAVAARSRPIVGAAAAASESAPVPDPSPGMSPRFRLAQLAFCRSASMFAAMLRSLPAGFIVPCLPTKADTLPSGEMWLHEIKHDGFRIIVRKSNSKRVFGAAALRAGDDAFPLSLGRGLGHRPDHHSRRYSSKTLESLQTGRTFCPTFWNHMRNALAIARRNSDCPSPVNAIWRILCLIHPFALRAILLCEPSTTLRSSRERM